MKLITGRKTRAWTAAAGFLLALAGAAGAAMIDDLFNTGVVAEETLPGSGTVDPHDASFEGSVDAASTSTSTSTPVVEPAILLLFGFALVAGMALRARRASRRW